MEFVLSFGGAWSLMQASTLDPNKVGIRTLRGIVHPLLFMPRLGTRQPAEVYNLCNGTRVISE